jgi:NADPH:quinone reductase-like Zn-dependent oxidoreductase
MGRWIQALVMSPFVSHTLRPLSSTPNEADLRLLKEIIEAGKVTPVVDRTYPLSQVADAIRYVSEGHTRGKIVINVRP